MINMNFTFIDENVAISPMPYQNLIDELSKQFKAVVILAEEYELEYDIENWSKFNVDTLWIPTRDFTAPQLLQIYLTVKWIKKHVDKGQKVLIHCVGGKGRSGTIAVAYTIYTKHVSFIDALKHVRAVRRGAVETWEQGKRLKTFETLLNVLPEPKLTKIVEIAEKYNYGRGIGHASKVTELSLALWEQLKQKNKILHLCGTILAAAAIIHDVGVFISDLDHHKHTLKLIRENENNLRQFFSRNEYDAMAWTAYYHRTKAGDPRTNIKLIGDVKDIVTWSAAILRVADALDYGLNQSVETVSVDFQTDKLIINVYCNIPCKYEISRAVEKSKLLRNLMKTEITLRKYGHWTPS